MVGAVANLLDVNDLCVDFRLHDQGVVQAVRGVSFHIAPGRTVALVGESGSGKSVISQAIMGILPRSAAISGGSILFDDREQVTDLAALDPDSSRFRAIRGDRISMIFQEPMTSLSPLHTVGNQVSEAVRLHQAVTADEANERAERMLDRVGFPNPSKAMATYPFELSGGLRQRAMIAMALVCRPALLIADEPTTALDVTIQAQTLKLIQELQSDLHMAVLLITHDLGVVANMADEVVVVYHGRLMERGSADAIFRRPKHPYLKALMKAVPRMGMDGVERLTPLREVAPSVDGHLMTRDPWPEGASDAGPLLSVSHVSKEFRLRQGGWFGTGPTSTIKALDDVSLTIERGTCLGLVGESGCGKTTLSKVIMRAIDADRGDVVFNDRGQLVRLDQLRGDALTAFRRRVQFVFQDPFSSLNPRMTVFDIISEPLVIHDVGDREHRAGIVRELMSQVGLDPRFLSRYPHSFSGGQRQRIGIARALALNPELLVCDEPVSALDVSVQAQILNLLKDLQRELGLTYLFVSHNLAVVDYMADQIAVMCAGRMVELAPREELFRRPIHPYTQALLAAVPRPDLDDPLDLTALMEGKSSDPGAWEAPFGQVPRLEFIDLGGGHFVRADPGFQKEARTQ
ncbi:MAG: ABC transporter ATP-binding protein [Pseudomonadota bacterium]